MSSKPEGNVIKQGEEFSADKISISIESLKTGIDLRDEHTWKHLNTSKHPKAILSEVKGRGGKATGSLEVNGIKNAEISDSDRYAEGMKVLIEIS